MADDDDDHTRIIPDDGVRKGAQLNGIYEIDELIATGGMGEVYRGHNIQTGDPVAIKVVLREFARDQGILALFRKEASVLNHLSHEAIVRYHVFSIDPTINRPYLAMEYVNGESLGDRMRRGPLDPRDAHRMLARLAAGLWVAHEAGIIHRDLSPDNIVLPGGSVEKAKIIDFGIARSATVGGGTLIGGNFAGKYNFVSPEQLGLFGGEVTERSDIYSLGLIIAGALRGKSLDMSGSPVEVIEKRRHRPDCTGIDDELRPLLEMMLEPDPRDRPQSAVDIVEWLRANSTRSLPPSALSALSPIGEPVPRSQVRPPAATWIPPASAAIENADTLVGESPFKTDSSLSKDRPEPSGGQPAGGVLPPPPRPLTGERRAGRSGLVISTAAVLLLVAASGIGAFYAGLLDPFFRSSRQTSEGSAPPPADSPPKSTTDQTSAATGEPAATPPSDAPSAEPPTKADDVPQLPAETAKPTAAVGSAEWLAAFNGGPCFYAAFEGAGDAAQITGFAPAETPFDELRSALGAAGPTAPAVHPHIIAQDQCAVADFLNAVRAEAANGPALELSADQLKSGESLRGKLATGTASKVDLFLIDKNGIVYNLEDLLKRGADGAATFSIKVTSLAPADNQPEPQLIVALESPNGVRAAEFQGSAKASDLLPKISAEMTGLKDAGVAVGYFLFGK